MEKVTEFKYLGHSTHLKSLQKKKYMPGSEQRRAVLEVTREYSKIDNSPFHFKKKTITRSNVPMCLANNDLQLPNMVSQ